MADSTDRANVSSACAQTSEASVSVQASEKAPQRSCLSIQSHVVGGYVGNKCAVFPLQLFGFDVSPLNSVQFSNHTGYPKFTGSSLDGTALTELADGLEANNLLDFSHVLTGYMRDATFARAVVSVVQRARRHRPELEYVCDPVLGDNGRLYVPEAMVGVYRDEVVPCATMVTPNQFEAEQLSGVAIKSVGDAAKACEWFHERGVRAVVITSMDVHGPDRIVVMCSWQPGAGASGSVERRVLELEKYDAHFTGTGDLLAALLLAWRDRLAGDMEAACERALSTVQGICKRTLDAGSRELRLVQSRDLIDHPPPAPRARTLSAVERADIEAALAAAAAGR